MAVLQTNGQPRYLATYFILFLTCSALFTVLGDVPAVAQQDVIQTFVGDGKIQDFLGTTISPGFSTGLASDSAGNVFVAVGDANMVVRIDAVTSKLSVVAGTGVAGYSGDNGFATHAQLNGPVGIALDRFGNIYVADSKNYRVREISNGIIRTFAGNGNYGDSGDGGLASNAEIRSPLAITFSPVGDFYVVENSDRTDSLSSYVRKVSNGVISTIQYCNQQSCWPFEWGNAKSIAVDSSGSIYIAHGCYVDAYVNQQWTPIAGDNKNYLCGYSGDNGPALEAELGVSVLGIALDAAGNVYIADSGNNRIRKVSNGIIRTVAGNGTLGEGGDGGLSTSAQLVSPGAVIAGSKGTFYVVDSGNQRIRKISNGLISTILGNTTLGSNGDNGPALEATLALAPSVAVDSHGNIYIAETGSHRVRKVEGNTITTVAGDGKQGFSGDNGPAATAELSGPTALAVSSSGDLYIADTGNNRVRRVSNGIITTMAGNGTQGYGGDGGLAAAAQMKFPTGLAIDTSGTLYISDTGNRVIRQVTNGIISTFAGNPHDISANCADDQVPLARASFKGPTGLAVAEGSLYVADTENACVVKISGGTMTRVAGADVNQWGGPIRGFGGDNGPANKALLNFPVSVAVDQSGNLYIADGLNQRIRKVSNGVITTIAGSGIAGYSGNGGPATLAQLTWPSGVAVDKKGHVYIADAGNRRIRVVGAGPKVCTLNVTKNGSGTGIVTSVGRRIDCGETCSGYFSVNSNLILTPNGTGGSRFDGWAGCDSLHGPMCVVSMTRSRDVNASFSKDGGHKDGAEQKDGSAEGSDRKVPRLVPKPLGQIKQSPSQVRPD